MNHPHLLGAEGARELVAFLAGNQPVAEIARTAAEGQPVDVLRLSRTRPAAAADTETSEVMERHLVQYLPEALVALKQGTDFAPPRTLLVIDHEIDTAALPVDADSAVLRLTAQGWTFDDRPLGHDEDTLQAAITGFDPHHIRVVTDLGPTTNWLDTDPAMLLRLHDAAFLAARATTTRLSAGGSYYVLALRGADDHAVTHPYAGLFTGLLKTLEIEPEVAGGETGNPGVDCFALLTSTTSLPTAIAELQEESRARRATPTVLYANGRRHVQRALPAPLPPSTAGPALPPDAVVVGAGASRGIGMAMLLGLAERYRPHVHVFGSNDLSAYPAEVLHESDDAFRSRRRDHLLHGTKGPRRRSVAQLNAELRLMAQARDAYANLQRLKELCGPERVHYYACDMNDGAAVRTCVQRVLSVSGGQVDLVLNLAGINRAAQLTNKSLSDFRATRDVKVHAYRHLKAAFAGSAPRWINTSSIAGVYGTYGEIDYSAGNDFLLTAGVYESACEGSPESSIGWGVWGEIGRSVEEGIRQVLDRNNGSGRMPTAEGLRHLCTELGQPAAVAATTFFGAVERAWLARLRPHIAELWTPPVKASTPPFFDEITERTRGRLVAYRNLTLERDGYLEDHLIQGHPTMPGLLLTEFAAQAATELVDGRVPVALEDLAFQRYVRVYRGSRRPERKKIVAELLSHDPAEAGESAVLITISSDLLAPDGTVLVKDKLHATMRVLLRDRAQPAPRLAAERLPRITDDAVEIRSPYQIESPVAKLGGIFSASATIFVGSAGNQARMRLNGPRLRQWFEHARVPAILCDAVAQISAVSVQDGWSAVVAPRFIERIDLYGGFIDAQLAGEEAELTLTSTAPSYERTSFRGSWSAVTRADGQVVLRISGADGDVLGYVHQRSGEFNTPQQRAAAGGEPAAGRAPKPPAGPGQRPPAEDEPAVRPHLLAFDPEMFARPAERMDTFAVPFPLPAPAAGTPVGTHSYVHDRTVLLLGHQPRLVAEVGERLRKTGVTVHSACTLAELSEVAPHTNDWDGILDLNLTGTTAYQLGDPAWERAIALSTAAVHLVYAPWSREFAYHRHFYLTVGNEDGLFGRSEDAGAQPLAGAWTGLVKTLAVELPTMAAKAIDLDTTDPVAITEVILREAGVWDAPEIGYRAGRRHRLELCHAPLPHPSADPAAALTPDDCVLISGGGRGIGFEMARSLATGGIPVVVTGREQLLPDDDPRSPDWLTMNEAAFAAWRTRRLKQAHAVQGGVREALRAIDKAGRTRLLRQNLRTAAADGLPIEYRTCDITDRTQVEKMLTTLDRSPTALIHNAGIYRGVRFSAYDQAEIVRTVAVKVTGFANLLQALLTTERNDRPLRMVCNISSVSGRFGGMVGHVAYAQANNALSQLGFWAAKQYGRSVQTICWPTWERTGNIVSYLGAARYGSTVDVAEGTAHWHAELAALAAGGRSAGTSRGGESVYLGRVGVVPNPGLLAAISWPEGHPDAPRMATFRHLSGEVTVFDDHHRFAAHHTFLADTEPHLTHGELSLPVLLEHVLAAGDWVRPEDYQRQHLSEIAHLTVDHDGLRLRDRVLKLDVEAVGAWSPDHWDVTVTVTAANGTTVLSCVLRSTGKPAEIPAPPPHAIAIPVSAHSDAALWCGPRPPRASLPHPALDAVIRQVRSRGPGSSATRLTIRRLVPVPGCLAGDTLHVGGSDISGSGTDSTTYQLTVAGKPVLLVEGIQLEES